MGKQWPVASGHSETPVNVTYSIRDVSWKLSLAEIVLLKFRGVQNPKCFSSQILIIKITLILKKRLF